MKFIWIIDRLFDTMNSRNPLAKGYKTGPVGFIASSISIMHLFDSNVNAGLHPLKYLLKYTPSQDNLELFFAVGHSRGGVPTTTLSLTS